MPNRLLIRADGGARLGAGHVMRCLALAQAWERSGGRCLFAQADSTPALVGRLQGEGLDVVRLAAAQGSEDDARETIKLGREHQAAWIVADGYAFGESWQKQVTAAGFRLLVLDDCGRPGHFYADTILNQNVLAEEILYPRREPSTQLLLGTRYALLRREFQAWRDWSRPIPPAARKILVTLGGGDPDNVTAKVVQALGLLPGTEAVVVVGGSNPHRAALEAAVGAGPATVRLVFDPPNFPELMAWADVALSAAGSTVWELASLGLPAALVVLAENQREIAAGLQRQGAAIDLGWHEVLAAEQIAAALQTLLADGDRRREMSARARQLVDGHGASRLAAALGAQLNLTLVSDADSWMNAFLPELKAGFEADGHRVRWIHDPAAIEEGDIAFLLSLGRIVPAAVLHRHAHNLVVHESALPEGRGWSPLTWQILEGKREIAVTLFEAAAGADSGVIYDQDRLRFQGTELLPELRAAQAAATLQLCRRFVARYPAVSSTGRPQVGVPTYYPRRRAADSRLDPDKTLREQFNLLRVADPERYPALIDIDGQCYQVQLHHHAARD